MADEIETKTRRFKLIHLEILLLTLETLAMWLLLTAVPLYFTVYCSAANFIRLLYSGLCRRPDYIEATLDITDYVEEYYGFLFVERLLTWTLIYFSCPAKFWYIMVGTSAMSTICSVAIACNIYLARRRQLRNRRRQLRNRRSRKSGQRLENNEDAAGRPDRVSSSIYPCNDIYIYVV